MKSKMLKIILGVAAVVVLAFGGWYIGFTRFAIGPSFPILQAKEIDTSQVRVSELAENQLIGLADTEEQAQEIAEQYGITLVSYDMGVATYHSEENPLEVINRGKENGYPELSLNHVQSVNEK